MPLCPTTSARTGARVPTLIVFVGLPGSGKSYHLESMVRNGELAEDRIWHDYHAESLDDTHEIEKSRFFIDLLTALLAGETCAIADSWFCYPGHTEKLTSFFAARVPQLVVDVLYFANTPAACALNVRHAERSDTIARLQLIGALTPNYWPPAGITPIQVFAAQLAPES